MNYFELYETPEDIPVYLHNDVHKGQRLRLYNYMQQAKNSSVLVKYEQKIYNKETNASYGRYFPSDSSLMPAAYQWRKVRTTLFSKNEYDIDIVNAHPTILLSICKRNKIRILKGFNAYINNRDKVISETYINPEAIARYNIKNKSDRTHKDMVKILYTATLYGMSYKKFLKEYEFNESDVDAGKTYDEYRESVSKIMSQVVNLNEFADMKKDMGDIPNHRFLSCILQNEEAKIVVMAMDQYKRITGKNIKSYIYDGFQVEKHPDIDNILKKINKTIKVEMNYEIEFIRKDFSEGLDDNYENPKFINFMNCPTNFNANLILRDMMNDVLIDNNAYYSYNGKKWDISNMCEIKGKITDDFVNVLTQNIIEYYDPTHIPDAKLKKKIRNDSKRLIQLVGSASFINNTFGLCFNRLTQCLKFDDNRFLLNGINGTLDFKTMTITEHNKDNMCSYITKSNIRLDATKDDFKELYDLISQWVDEPDYVLTLIAQALNGMPMHEKAINFLGELSRNGKSSFEDILLECLGDYGGVLKYQWLCEEQDANKPDPLLMKVIKKRLLFINEAEEKEINTSKFKQITGKDIMTYRDLYASSHSSKEASFQASLIFVSNEPLRFQKMDNAIMKRLIHVRFDNMFGDENDPEWNANRSYCKRVDLNLKSKIKSGYFNDMMMDALMYYYQNPAKMSDKFCQDNKKQVLSLDPIKEWCDEYIFQDDSKLSYSTDSFIYDNFTQTLDMDKEYPRVLTFQYMHSRYMADTDNKITIIKFNRRVKDIYNDYPKTKTKIFGGNKEGLVNFKYVKYQTD